MTTSSTACIDANLVVRVIKGLETDPVRALWQSWAEQSYALVAPMLLRYEVTNTFRRTQVSGLISDDEARESIQAALKLPVQVYTLEELHISAFDFAVRFNMPATYDAHYLALAERLGVEFYTGDRRLWNAVRHQLPWVRLVESESAD